MTTLADPDIDVKLLKEKKRFKPLDQEPRWSLRCMHRACSWNQEGLQNEAAATAVAQFHANATGHPVKLHAVIGFDCGVVRPQSATEVR